MMKTLSGVLIAGLILSACSESSGDSSALSQPNTIDCSTSTALSDALLCYVNQARSTPQDCDGDGTPETGAPGYYLSYNGLLESVALDHTNNMASKGYLGHFTDNLATADPNGDQDTTDPNYLDLNNDSFNDRWITGRVASKGYSFSAVAENVARGGSLDSAQKVVESWLQSQGHCMNIMSSSVTEMGGARVSNNATIPTYYWTLVLAKPAP